MLPVPGGPFTMGADSGGEEDEHPAHTVTLAAFFLDKTEVTNAAWDECVAAKVLPPQERRRPQQAPRLRRPEQPVLGHLVGRRDRATARGSGKRLPREAEFEKAARDTDDRRFAWGNDQPTHERAVFSCGRAPRTSARTRAAAVPTATTISPATSGSGCRTSTTRTPTAARAPPRASPARAPRSLAAQDELRRTGKQGFTGTNPIPDECEHSIRGGAYNYDAHGLRVTNRVHHPGRYRIPMLGVRCARDAAP